MAISNRSTLNERIDDYIEQLYAPTDSHLDFVLQNARRNGLPDWSVSPNEGKLLYMLVKLTGAKRILEIGTLGGYSTVWMGRALPQDGYLLSLEYDVKHARVATENIARSGLSDLVEVRQGDARQLLPLIAEKQEEPFDLFFIDADKTGYPAYLDWAIKLGRPGSVILTDNVIWGGAVLDASLVGSGDVETIARYNRQLASHLRLETIILPLVRGNVDGLAISRVRA